jgi:hypothetical protein
MWILSVAMAVAGGVHDYGLFPDHFYKVKGVGTDHTNVELGVPVGP